MAVHNQTKQKYTIISFLGLPNNALPNVPMNALSALTSLDRLDLSNNNIKTLGSAEFLVGLYHMDHIK